MLVCMYVCVCVFFLFLNAYRKAIIHQKQVITIKHTHTHTHVYYTITVARFLAIDDHHGGVFFQKENKKIVANVKQQQTS